MPTITGVVTNGVIVPDSPLPEGVKVEVTVVAREKPTPQFRSALEFLKSLPPAHAPGQLFGPQVGQAGGAAEQHVRADGMAEAFPSRHLGQ